MRSWDSAMGVSKTSDRMDILMLEEVDIEGDSGGEP